MDNLFFDTLGTIERNGRRPGRALRQPSDVFGRQLAHLAIVGKSRKKLANRRKHFLYKREERAVLALTKISVSVRRQNRFSCDLVIEAQEDPTKPSHQVLDIVCDRSAGYGLPLQDFDRLFCDHTDSFLIGFELALAIDVEPKGAGRLIVPLISCSKSPSGLGLRRVAQSELGILDDRL
jgi:hypothetical protein